MNILCDITQVLPFKDDSTDAVLLDNVIEHILDIPKLFSEVIRICKKGAQVTIITPHFTSQASWRDPTHLHHLSYFSMDHFEKAATAHYMHRGEKRIYLNKGKLSFGGGLLGIIGRILFYVNPTSYEKKYCFMFRASTITWVLAVR